MKEGWQLSEVEDWEPVFAAIQQPEKGEGSFMTWLLSKRGLGDMGESVSPQPPLEESQVARPETPPGLF